MHSHSLAVGWRDDKAPHCHVFSKVEVRLTTEVGSTDWFEPVKKGADVTVQGVVLVRDLVGRIGTGGIRFAAALMSDTLRSYQILSACLTLPLDKMPLAHQALSEWVGQPITASSLTVVYALRTES